MSKNIVIFSTKGGVGKTFVAVNLAVSLAKEKQRVCLVDLDLPGPSDMAKILGVEPKRSIKDLILVLKDHPQEFKKEEFLINQWGVDFLNSTLKIDDFLNLNPEDIKIVLNFLDNEYDYLVIDTADNFSETLITALNQANLVLLVVTPEIPAIYQAKWALDTLELLKFPLAMVYLILNRAGAAASISWQEIKLNLAVEIIMQIPSEGRAATLAVNRAVPVVIDNPKAKITLAFKKLVKELLTKPELFIKRYELADLFSFKGLEKEKIFWQDKIPPVSLKTPAAEEVTDEILLLKKRVHGRLIEELNIKRLDLRTFSDAEKIKNLRDKAEGIVINLLTKEAGIFITSESARKQLTKEILDEALGLGPLEDLLADPTITDIMVNNKDEVYIERFGKIELTGKKFISNEQVRTVIERILAPIGRRIDESMPMVDARLPDGSRVNAIIPPLSLTGPSLTIRKFRKERFKIDELIQLNTLSPAMAEFLKASVIGRKNMVVSGGTGSGKTTVLNILSEFIPDNERIVTIEDAAELKLHQQHWIRLESRPPNIEGKGAITIRDLFRNTLRMRPDRIIIGECRGQETLDMLQAMNTGHDGSLTTIHANSTHDVLVRLDSMILMSGIELPIRAIREMIASAIDLIIHTARLSDGSRKIVQITEVAGMKDEIHIDLRDIFIFKQTGLDQQGKVLGDFQATGYIPSFIEDIRIKGILLPEDIFNPPTS